MKGTRNGFEHIKNNFVPVAITKFDKYVDSFRTAEGYPLPQLKHVGYW